MLEEAHWSRAESEQGWYVRVVDSAQANPPLPVGWKAYKYEVPSPVKMKETRRYAWMAYDPHRWVWLGEAKGGTVIYACGGREFCLGHVA